jgi:hypothetical protein
VKCLGRLSFSYKNTILIFAPFVWFCLKLIRESYCFKRAYKNIFHLLHLVHLWLKGTSCITCKYKFKNNYEKNSWVTVFRFFLCSFNFSCNISALVTGNCVSCWHILTNNYSRIFQIQFYSWWNEKLFFKKLNGTKWIFFQKRIKKKFFFYPCFEVSNFTLCNFWRISFGQKFRLLFQLM